ncbi:HET-E1, partial [Symbiodinium sp. CCMP2456]
KKEAYHLAKTARGWSPEDSSSWKDVCPEEKASGSESRADVWRKAVAARGWTPEEGSTWPDEEDEEPESSEEGSGQTDSSTAHSTISMLLNIFSSPVSEQEEEQPPPSPELEELRRAVLAAEALSSGQNSELLEHVRAKLEELEAELARDVKVHIVNGMSGELAAVVRARPGDTAFRLKEAILSEGLVNSEEDGLCSINFLHGGHFMDESKTLAEAGIRDGDQVQLVRSPLRCLTASLDGTVRLWQLDSK